MQRVVIKPVLRQEKMSLYIVKASIYPPGTEPIVVIKEDDSILIGAYQTFDLSRKLSHTVTSQ